jgi:ABC-type Fe3+ transport system substrate-binding protein
VVLFVPSEIPRIAVITAVPAAAPVNPANADRLMTYLNSDRCQAIFRTWGYLITEAEVTLYAPAAQIGGKPKI